MTLKKWLRGLVGAAINAGVGAITIMAIDPTTFNLFHGGAKELGAAMLSQAVIGALLWAKTHPVPIDDEQPSLFV